MPESAPRAKAPLRVSAALKSQRGISLLLVSDSDCYNLLDLACLPHFECLLHGDIVEGVDGHLEPLQVHRCLLLVHAHLECVVEHSLHAH